MKMRFLVPAAFAVATLSAAKVEAQVYPGNTNRTCSLDSFIGFSADACYGFNSGNELGGSADKRALQNLAVNTLRGTTGINYYSQAVEKIGSVGNGDPVDFNALLYGTTVVGFHFGNGADVFGGAPAYNGSGGGTAYFVFDAGNAGLDQFEFIAGLSKASSGATLYLTGVPCEEGICEPVIVPEPASFAMMFFGLAGLGVAARRRRNV